MARARSVKPGFFKNEELCELPPFARLLFAGLWTLADRAGRLEDRPKRIKAEVFPYDNVSIEKMLHELAKHKFITRYERDGNRFISIPTWNKHQNPHIKEPASMIPPPEETGSSTVLEPGKNSYGTGISGTSPADSLFPISDSPFPEPGTPGSPGARAMPLPRPDEHAPADWCQRMYGRHPKRRDKILAEGECARLWAKFHNPPGQSAEIERVHGLWCQTESWRDKNGQFAPTLAAWLRDEGYMVEPESVDSKARDVWADA